MRTLGSLEIAAGGAGGAGCEGEPGGMGSEEDCARMRESNLWSGGRKSKVAGGGRGGGDGDLEDAMSGVFVCEVAIAVVR